MTMLTPRTRWSALAAGAVVAVTAAGWFAGTHAMHIRAPKTGGPEVLPAAAASPAPPAALQSELVRLVQAYGEEVGVAVTDVPRGWTAQVNGDQPFPQQSVSKLWVALAVLKAADAGRLGLDSWVTLTNADRSVFFQPVAYAIGPAGYTTQVSSLLRRAIVDSDNAANDKLMRIAGGPDSVDFAVAAMGLRGVTVGAYEHDLQAMTAGLPWKAEYGVGWNFQAARERLPPAVRQAALDAYLRTPLDGAAPVAITRALARLQRGDLLSPASTGRLLSLMREVRTGPRRLKGGLQPGWTLAHKTGTGQDYRGASVGINDVGLLTAPDGHVYAVAVMIRRTRQPVPARLALMQAVSRAVATEWSRERGEAL